MGVASVSDKARTEADAGGPIHRDAGSNLSRKASFRRPRFSATAPFLLPSNKAGSRNGAHLLPGGPRTAGGRDTPTGYYAASLCAQLSRRWLLGNSHSPW